MKIYCPSCGRDIPAADVDLSGKIAKCAGCNNVFSLPFSATAAAERTPIGKPNNFQLERSAEGLCIVRKWFTPSIIFLTFFCLFWNGFMAVWFYIAFKQKIYVMALFGSLHGAIGLGLLYTVLAGYLNKTYIRISYNSLTITHRPLPFLGQKNLTKQDLKQLYSKETIPHGENSNSSSFSVQAITKSGKIIELVSGLPTSEEALFIEQEVEKYLKIDDEPVRGEIPR